MIGVVAHPEVHYGRLRTGGLDGGIAVDDAGGGVEAGIADAEDADFGVVVGDVLEQPVDGVGHVGGLVDAFAVFGGRHLEPVAFAVPAAADVLADEDVAVMNEVGVAGDVRLDDVVVVVAAAVGSARHEERIGAAVGELLGDGRVDDGVEFDSVAHGHVVLVLGVVRAVELFKLVTLVLLRWLRGGGCRLGGAGKGQGGEQKRRHSQAEPEVHSFSFTSERIVAGRR